MQPRRHVDVDHDHGQRAEGLEVGVVLDAAGVVGVVAGDIDGGWAVVGAGDPEAISWDETVWASWAGTSGSVLVS